MQILIAESRTPLANLWKGHMERWGAQVDLANCANEAREWIETRSYEVILLDVMLDDGEGLCVADYARYRHPETRVVFVSSSGFFSDGSIFRLSPNARAFLPRSTTPDDLSTLVEHYAKAG